LKLNFGILFCFAESSGDDFYKSMVVAAVIAAIAILGLIVVMGFYLKRTTTYKAIISGNVGQSVSNDNGIKATYDNRGFKVMQLHSGCNAAKRG
jgi:predicted permease